MAVKFSQFTAGSTASDIDFVVGYKSTANVRIPIGLVTANTTYTVATAQSGSNETLTLTGSDASTDSITITAGTNISLTDDGAGNGFTISSLGIDGSGTTNYISKFTDADTLGDSIITDNGTIVTVNGSGVISGDLTVDTDTLFVNSSNNRVGIGTTSPSETLSVSGNMTVSGSSFLDGLVTIDHNLNIQASGVIQMGGTEVISATRGVNASTGLFSGNVGIGTTSPAVTLDISGTDAVKLPSGTTGERPGAPAAGMLRYNSTDGAFEGYTTGWGAIGGGGGGVTIVKDQFTGDNSTTAFTLSVSVSSADNINIFISGVYQNSLDSAGVANYSVSGTTLTFVTAPPVTATNGIEVVITQ